MNTLEMNTKTISAATRLSNQEVVAEVKRLAGDERDTMVSLIAHLSVLDERGLYREEGCSSTFTYCVKVLHLSEFAAFARIAAARAARKYPIILRLLEDGSINLTTVTMLRKLLTPENHLAVLEEAKHQRKHELKKLVAALRPQSPVPDAIRKLPQPQSPTLLASTATRSTESQAAGDAPGSAPLTLMSPPTSPSPGLLSPARRPAVEPLAPDCYKIQFTAGEQTVEKLRRLQDLLRHQIPNGDLSEIMDRAVTVLLEQVEKQKIGATDRPRSGRVPEGTVVEKPPAPTKSRHIPTEVRRAVWNRDDGQCAFVGSNGHRCTERGFLEFHHKVPYYLGGEATIDNIELRCRAHNVYEFERGSMSWKDASVRELGLDQVALQWSGVVNTMERAFRPLRR